MKTGPTVKLIRKLKGFTQKEVYGDIMTRSFANRFEKGTNDISAAKLFVILNHLSTTPNEFEFIANGYQVPVLNQYLSTVIDLYNQQAFVELSQWIQKQKQRSVANDKLKIAIGYAEVILAAYSYLHIPLNNSMRYFLTTIYQNKQWTLQEIEVAPLLIPIIDKQNQLAISMDQLIAKMEFSCETYTSPNNDYFGVLKHLITFYSTILQKYLNDREFEKARQLINKFDRIDQKRLNLGETIKLTFWKIIWRLYFDDFDKSKQQLERIMAAIEILPTNHQSALQAVYKVRVKEAKRYQERINKNN